MTWHQYFLNLAAAVAQKSKDPNTKVGAVIVHPTSNRVLATGFNGMVAGAPEIWTRPEKYTWVCHAEENAIVYAARYGATLDGAAAYITHAPCLRCAKMLLQAGISHVYFPLASHSVAAAAEFSNVLELFSAVGATISEI